MNLRQQIEEMTPERYARAAKRAAELAVELANEAGTSVTKRVQFLADSSVEYLTELRRRQIEAPSPIDEIRDYAENFWLRLVDPRDGQRKSYIDQADLLALLDELEHRDK